MSFLMTSFNIPEQLELLNEVVTGQGNVVYAALIDREIAVQQAVTLL